MAHSGLAGALFILCLLPELVLPGVDWGLWGGTTRWQLRALQNAGFWAGLLENWCPSYVLQPWTMFLTYDFLHAGVVHFAVNMVNLFSLSPDLIGRFDQSWSSRFTPCRFWAGLSLCDLVIAGTTADG
ncbi:rhomboid family intramembrane serine protease [Tabrizicola sp. WMC-M-20]|nr:rhomboid family intramembrane serine protease [Tabrizicola sp. WMC-M-20]